MRIGDKISFNRIDAVFVEEIFIGKCSGCVFYGMDCPVNFKISDYPLCQTGDSGIFKQDNGKINK